MNTDSQLLVGVILIGVGITLALLAYFILTERDEREEIEDEVISQPEPAEEGGLVQETPPEEEPAVEAKEPPAEEAPPEPPETRPAQPGEARITVATLLRDEVSGVLIVRVGEREYHNPEELKGSQDWTRVRYAASDLLAWLPPPTPTEARLEEKPEPAQAPPGSMIEQINEILQQQLSESSVETKAVRLIEGPGGGVRVLIGVHSYAIDEVPDPEVSALIRAAVSAWEDQQ